MRLCLDPVGAIPQCRLEEVPALWEDWLRTPCSIGKSCLHARCVWEGCWPGQHSLGSTLALAQGSFKHLPLDLPALCCSVEQEDATRDKSPRPKVTQCHTISLTPFQLVLSMALHRACHRVFSGSFQRPNFCVSLFGVNKCCRNQSLSVDSTTEVAPDAHMFILDQCLIPAELLKLNLKEVSGFSLSISWIVSTINLCL